MGFSTYPVGARSGVVSFFGVWNSLVTADEVSLRGAPASGVVASLDEADVTSGGAGKAGALVATGVFCIDPGLSAAAGLETTVSTTAGVVTTPVPVIAGPDALLGGFGVVGSECLSREKGGE